MFGDGSHGYYRAAGVRRIGARLLAGRITCEEAQGAMFRNWELVGGAFTDAQWAQVSAFNGGRVIS